jgi:hypothetical protein
MRMTGLGPTEARALTLGELDAWARQVRAEQRRRRA